MKCPTTFISGYLSCVISELHGGMDLIRWQILFCIIVDPAMVCCFCCGGKNCFILRLDACLHLGIRRRRHLINFLTQNIQQ